MDRCEPDGSSRFTIDLSPEVSPYAASAIARLRYLRPGWTFVERDGAIEVEADASSQDVGREVFHAIYREKIYTETLPLRRDLFAMLAKP